MLSCHDGNVFPSLHAYSIDNAMIEHAGDICHHSTMNDGQHHATFDSCKKESTTSNEVGIQSYASLLRTLERSRQIVALLVQDLVQDLYTGLSCLLVQG